MLRKILIFFLMIPLVAAAIASGTTLPVVLLMVGLILIALAVSSAREEIQE